MRDPKKDRASGGTAAPRRRRSGLGPVTRWTARAAFYLHLWLGVLAVALFVILGVTGILLNHKKALGYQPDPENTAPAALGASLPLAELATRARAARADGLPPRGPEVTIDRMDVRPDDGLVKVRFDDAATTEVVLALDDGRVLSNAPRQDVFLERLHSGELFGDGWILLSDAAAVALALLLASGLWLWLFPRWRQ